MARAYLRLDPAFFDRKVIDQKYPPGAVAALVGAICHAEHQPQRGRFRDERVLRSLLGPVSRWLPFLIEKRDLVKLRGRGGELYVDGWDEWQEGDWKVGERVARIRNREKVDSTVTGESVGVTPDVTPGVTVDVTVPSPPPDSVTTVTSLSDGDRQSVIDSGSSSGRHSAGSSLVGETSVAGARETTTNRNGKKNGPEKAIDIAEGIFGVRR